MKKTALCLLALLAATVHALSEAEAEAEWKAVNAACEQRDYSTACQKYEQLAQAGDAEAQFKLARMYRKGQGVVQDGGKALMWYEKSAAQGDAAAQTALGASYFMGRGVAGDYGKARAWLEKSAAQSHQAAKDALKMLDNGEAL